MGNLEDIGPFKDSDIDLGEEIELKEPKCSFVTGSAGTGKTYMFKKHIEEDPEYGILCATTGIAAVNLNSRTINSVLGYFNTESLEDNFQTGALQSRLRWLAMENGVKRLVIDEVSMMQPRQLQIIYEAVKNVNNYVTMQREGCELEIILTGDFLQLPPVYKRGENNDGYVFNAPCWPKFEENTTRLTKIWRQDNPQFLEAVNLLRAGKGGEAAEVLKTFTRFQMNNDPQFEGTTILATNDRVDRMNLLRMLQVKGRPIRVSSRRWGTKPEDEWKLIPAQLDLKIGCLVMILANDSPNFTYVNGDLGHIVDYTTNEGDVLPTFQIKLTRNGDIVNVGTIHRVTMTKSEPDEVKSGRVRIEDVEICKPPLIPAPFGRLSRNAERHLWCVGGIEYFPLRVGYAATVYKTQGLTLDDVQIDYREKWFGNPGSLYVAVSRCKKPEGLRLVGMPDCFARRCVLDPAVAPWL